MKCHALLIWLILVSSVRGFAYAPNFITKIIQEQTGITPQGLLQVDPSEPNSANPENTKEQTPISSSSVRTRFPPEPNGYLHLGHAKAVSFNFAVARMFGGKCNMRMDDTNPSKEDSEYVASILEDVLWIQDGLFENEYPWDGTVRKTSDYFELICDCAIALIQSGDAYVDSLSADEMREYRGTLTQPGKDSPYRYRSIEENLELFRGMKNGDFPEGAHVLRAKIDMSSPNINMRDPTLYRIKHESHQETGDTWCIYPMYDFSHPIADAVEGITHSLCTLEFEDHRPFYDWTIGKLIPTGLITQKPQQIEFSRLNIQSTVLSKRKLIQLVQENRVSGWDDPRMPTLSGLRRRGVPPAALRLFCERMGISKADSNIDYTILEDSVRETMDGTTPRAFCVLEPLKVTITNWDGNNIENFEVDRHPKVVEMGKRSIPFGGSVYIERSDFFDVEGPEGIASNGRPPKGFKRLLPNEKVRLRYAYVIECNEVVRDPDTREPIELKCTYFPDTRTGFTPEGMPRVKGIIHWVESSTAVHCVVNQYDRLFSAEEPGKESGDFLADINQDSLQVIEGAVVEPSVAVDAGSALEVCEKRNEATNKEYPSSLAYQFERTGYFALDAASTASALVMNRVVTLRDVWGAKKKEAKNERSRGGEADGLRQSRSNSEPIEDIRRVAFRASTILSVDPHPEAENLYVCQVDCGDVNEDGEALSRTVVAGLAGKIQSKDIVGQKVVAVTNLKPARVRGIESTAMLLVASDGDGESEKVELLQIPKSVPNGELLSFDGKPSSEPDEMLKSKGAIKAWERAKACLRTNSEKEAVYLENSTGHRMMTSGGPVVTSSLHETVVQ